MNQTMDFEIPSSVRDLASKSVEQAREAYNRFLDASRQAHDVVSKSTDVLASGAREINEKAVKYTETNLQAELRARSAPVQRQGSKRSARDPELSLPAGRWKPTRNRLKRFRVCWLSPRKRQIQQPKTNPFLTNYSDRMSRMRACTGSHFMCSHGRAAG